MLKSDVTWLSALW